jgi:hypothetical protein
MATWQVFEQAAPELATAGRALLYQFGPGLGFLATVRRDGGPRLHPICPLIVAGRLVAFIVDSPKRDDLVRDGRYALHSFPPTDVDDEFYVTGRATPVEDPERRAAVSAAVTAQGTTHGEDDMLFEFDIAHALHAAYTARGPGSWPPTYTRWHDRASVSGQP